MVFAFASCLPTLLFISLSIFSIHGLGKCHVDDQTGLLDFKSGITQDPSGLLTSWKAGTDCCTWAGVSCRDGVRVNSVTVKGKQNDQRSYLSGTISSSLSKLRYLDGIYLQNLRNIAGTFPTSLYNLPNLLYVYIENNKLSGPIPADIGIRLYKLDALSLYGNRFSGPIPNSVSKLTGLTHLNLGGNALTGPILDGIRNLKNLTYLNFEKNHLSGIDRAAAGDPEQGECIGIFRAIQWLTFFDQYVLASPDGEPITISLETDCRDASLYARKEESSLRWTNLNVLIS